MKTRYYTDAINAPKEKIIEGVVVEKGKKTKVDIVLDSTFNEKSGRLQSISSQSIFF
jgi:hypothetical protein